MPRKFLFYDLESFDNAFSNAIYDPEENAVDIFADSVAPLMTDPATFEERLQAHVRACNPGNFSDGVVRYHDLNTREGYERMAAVYGVLPLVKGMGHDELAPKVPFDVTDPDAPYLLGYNSLNYDTPMLAWYFHECLSTSVTSGQFRINKWNGMPKAAAMRNVSDTMFTPEFRCSMPDICKAAFELDGSLSRDRGRPVSDWDAHPNRLRFAWLRSGLHVDVARLNEKQSRVALKRLCGMLGLQIYESEKLARGISHLDDEQDLMDMLAYNVSDVVNLAELFSHPLYKAGFDLRTTMLETYPELVFQTDADNKPVCDFEHMRRNRLRPDSTSQQFAARSLCPDGHIPDQVAVSLLYPSRTKADEEGVERVDVLDATQTFLLSTLANATNVDGKHEAIDAFSNVYRMYDDIRGKNLNGSAAYDEDHGSRALPFSDVGNPAVFPKYPTHMCYYAKDGSRTGSYVNFSTGGIHGAEYNKALYDHDVAAAEQEQFLLDRARFYASHLEPLSDEDEGTDDDLALRLRHSVPKLAAPIAFDFGDGKDHFVKEFLTSGSTKKAAHWRKVKKPELFPERKRSKSEPYKGTEFNKRYSWTSVGVANHEDFSSYYPNLLRQMSVFENPQLGYDRYGEQYDLKEEYGRQKKDPSLSEAERQLISDKREGTKLILNTASGAGDAGFDNPIRMNNNITAMRIIGQLFAYRIGQSQAAEGARVPSTNTDGLYTFMDQAENDRLLADAAASINIRIDPEVVHLVSKDANNRLEYKVGDDGSVKIVDASGSSLSCYKGPTPAQALAHPAIFDRLLALYMVSLAEEKGEEGFFEPFDVSRAQLALEGIVKGYENDLLKLLLLFQNVVASSESAMSYLVSHEGDPAEHSAEDLFMQHYNRVFMVKEGTPGARYVCKAAGRAVTDAMAKKRADADEIRYQHDHKALEVLALHGIDRADMEAQNREAAFLAFPQIDVDRPMLVVNTSLKAMSDEEQRALVLSLDMDAYIDRVRAIYEGTGGPGSGWRNTAVPRD